MFNKHRYPVVILDFLSGKSVPEQSSQSIQKLIISRIKKYTNTNRVPIDL